MWIENKKEKLSKNTKHLLNPSDITTVRQFKRIWALTKNKKTLHGGNTQ